MILHCTLPYWQDIPNAALGYLKGFLEGRDIHVKNVYWNLVLANRISDSQRIVGNYSRGMSPFYAEATAFYICRHSLAKNSENSSPTTSDLLFSSIYSKEELSEILHSMREDIDRYIKQNKLHESLLSGFTMKTYQWLMSYYLIRRLKEMNPETKILIGGITNESQALTFMRIFTESDFAIWGEGEFPLIHLARALEGERDIKNVPQLVYRDNGKTISTKRVSESCPPLDSYPFADHSDYFSTMKKFAPFKKSIFIPIWGSRSCNWNKCKFCAMNEKDYTYRARSPKNIVEEIELQSKRYNVDGFFFMDSDVAGNKERFRKLITLLIQSIKDRRRPYQLIAMISPIFIDFEVANCMKRAGFREMHIGFEAMTDSLLEKMQKRQRFVHNILALKVADKYELPQSGLNIIRGIPTETEEDIIESLENLKFLRYFLHEYYLSPNIFTLLKGSPFYDEMVEKEREEWKKDSLWEEIAPLHLIPESDRWEFFGFYKSIFNHYHQWDDFGNLLKFYTQQKYTYEWTEHSQGSLIKENGPSPREYRLDRDETDVLIYCDSIKTFSELKQEFSHLGEEQLLELLGTLRDSGLLYYSENDKRTISVLDATRKTPT